MIKRIALTLLCIGFVCLTMAQMPVNGLMAYYPFSGNTDDMSGNGLNGANNGAVLTTDRNGSLNSAYSFNGSSAYIQIPAATLKLTAFTYSVWAKSAVLPTFGAENRYCVFDIGSLGGDHMIMLGNNANAVGWHGSSYYGWEINPLLADVKSLPTAGQWYHLLITRSANTLTLYVDGVFVASKTVTPAPPYYGNGVATATIGRRFSANYYFKGDIDDLRIYNRALDSTEIKMLYTEECAGVFNTQPVSQSVDGTHETILSVKASQSDRHYQWQRSSDGLVYENLLDRNGYSGTNRDSLHIPAFNKIFYRCLLTGICPDTSASAILSIDSMSVTVYDTIRVITYDTIRVTVTDTLVIDIQLSVPGNSVNTVKVYPNPARDVIQVDFNEYTYLEGYSIRISNVLGQVVYSSPVDRRFMSIDMSSQTESGVYFISILDRNGHINYTQKFILR